MEGANERNKDRGKERARIQLNYVTGYFHPNSGRWRKKVKEREKRREGGVEERGKEVKESS